MRALISHMSGGPETLVLGDLPDPAPGPGDVCVDVGACAVNYPDVLIIEDKYQFKPARPFAPGSEVSGTISAIGEGVTGWSIGDRVFGFTISGGMAAKALIPANNTFRLPDHRSFVEGAALLMTYGTTIHALVDRGRIMAGDTMLVLGAAGGVGVAAIELGKAFGARVVAAVSSPEKAAFAREVGADEVVLYGRPPFDKDQYKALSAAFKQAVGPTGANIVYDAVGGDYAEPAIRSMAWEGRYLVVGFPAGIPKMPLNLALLKSCDICGVFWGGFAEQFPDANRVNVDRVLALWDEGKVNPRITATYPLERGGEAIAAMASRSVMGKIVVSLAD
jgi:NADPH:quinone reductase-like Zn-dependent oxidoreductase